MKTISENRAFGGVQGVYSHASEACQCEMTFGLFLPEAAEHGPVPVLWYLSGLTCTHENAMVKAGAQRWAAEAGIALVFPDTSPRGEDVADDADYDLGQGAGFYVDATDLPWAAHYRMWTMLTTELPGVLFNAYPLAEAAAVDHRAFDGRSWRADPGDEPAWPVSLGLGLCADLSPDAIRCGGASSSPPIWGSRKRLGRRMTRPC